MISVRPAKSKLLLLLLTLFYDVAFVDRIWTDPRWMRASIALLGVIMTGVSAIAYALDRLLLAGSLYPFPDAFIIGGALLFLVGGWRGRIDIAINFEASQQVLRSRGTVLCILSDSQQASSFLEELVGYCQRSFDKNTLKDTECYLVLASEIWRESLGRKGLTLLDSFGKRSLGDMLAGENSMPSM